jgi:serine/threonine-protein kinase
VYDYGVIERRGAYLVMERLHGATLRDEIRRSGFLDPGATADLFDQLLDGVAAAHAEGIVHRDLKPENIVIERRESGALAIKILDFGLAKFRPIDTELSNTALTEAGVVVGTFGYMAPEQLSGSAVDQRADIFAIGVILAEVLTGRRPFQRDTYSELLRAVLIDTYHLPGSSPEIQAIDALLQKCLAKRSEDRIASIPELRRELIPALRACPPLGAAAMAAGPNQGLSPTNREQATKTTK